MKNLISILLFIVSLNSCTKSNDTETIAQDQLPAITTSGANTFGCLINGKVLIPRSGSTSIGGGGRAVTVWGDVSGTQQYDEIDVKDFKSSRTAQILIHIQNIHQLGAGNYTINMSNGMSSIDGLNHNYIHCRVFNETTNSYQYYRSFDNCGTIKITTYNFLNDIIAGTFSCKVRNSSNPLDEIEISQGRFDINPVTILDKIFP